MERGTERWGGRPTETAQDQSNDVPQYLRPAGLKTQLNYNDSQWQGETPLPDTPGCEKVCPGLLALIKPQPNNVFNNVCVFYFLCIKTQRGCNEHTKICSQLINKIFKNRFFLFLYIVLFSTFY